MEKANYFNYITWLTNPISSRYRHMWHNKGTGNVQITKKNNNKLNWRKRIVRG